SALTLIARARAADPSDIDMRLAEARVRSWKGDLSTAEQLYRAILAQHPENADALAGLGYVYYWEGRERAARAQARAALAVDSTHKAGRDLLRTIEEPNRPATEATANWSNDSDHNTSFGQTLSVYASPGAGVGIFGSVSVLETSDPILEATTVGGEAGVSVGLGRFRLTGAAGARRLFPEVADPRTAATYRARLAYRPASSFGMSIGYSRLPFDEIASLVERDLDLELVEGGFEARPFAGFRIFATGSGLWLSDGNTRTGVLAGLAQKIHRRFAVGLFARTLSYEERGVGYFSPDRFSVLEATAGYTIETRSWNGTLGGGLGAQQVGERGAAQSEWHIEGRLARRWGSGNRVEVFGLVTNSAVSSTSGAFRYRSAGLTVRLGL
ncbi:MAG: hypothetical protein QOH59_3272, partial [Gemmatimonadales bacterium]|nr:hypothetical protein [Gemmatimonadales bacterium]